MEFLQQILLIFLTAGCGYGFNVLKENRSMKIRLKEKDAQIKEEREKMEQEIEEKQNAMIKLLCDAELTIIRIQLIHAHEKYMLKGWMPIYAKENLREMYRVYHELGGNGLMTKFYEEMINLPEFKKVEG